MTNTLTIEEIKGKYTIEDIINIFKKNNLYINQITDKKSKDCGMIIAFNNENSYFLFSSYTLAYHYFLKMNWI
jgi:hypothetical protein